MDEPTFRDLVNQVVDHFELDHEINVPFAAREALIRPGIPHLSNVTQGIDAGTITIERMQSAVREVLERALTLRRQITIPPSPLDEISVLDSMRSDCPYLFWC